MFMNTLIKDHQLKKTWFSRSLAATGNKFNRIYIGQYPKYCDPECADFITWAQ